MYDDSINTEYYDQYDFPSVPDWANPSTPDLDIDWSTPSYADTVDTSFNPLGGSGTGLSSLANLVKGLFRPGSQGGIGGSGIGMLPLLMAMMARNSRPGATGGGYTGGYAGPRQYNPQVVKSKYGPIIKYAQGGPVRMEDGGFVMTKRAVDGAGGPQGIQKLIPGARMIEGPGTGTSDDVPAVITGSQGTTPAALSNGEAYVPKDTVHNMGGAQRLYSLMNNLQKRG